MAVEVDCQRQGLPMAGDMVQQEGLVVGVGATPPTVQDPVDQDPPVGDLGSLEVDRQVDRLAAHRPLDRVVEGHLSHPACLPTRTHGIYSKASWLV